jgi:hypothetical protein
MEKCPRPESNLRTRFRKLLHRLRGSASLRGLSAAQSEYAPVDAPAAAAVLEAPYGLLISLTLNAPRYRFQMNGAVDEGPVIDGLRLERGAAPATRTETRADSTVPPSPSTKSPEVVFNSGRSAVSSAPLDRLLQLRRQCVVETHLAVCSRSGVAVAGRPSMPIEAQRRRVVT